MLLCPLEERWVVNGFRSASGELFAFVESLGIQNIPLIGSQFTIFEKGTGCAQNRLDRFLVKDISSWS